MSARARRVVLKVQGLRPANHRSWCQPCKKLTKRGVGKCANICLECGKGKVYR